VLPKYSVDGRKECMNQGLGEVQISQIKIIKNILFRSAPNNMFMQRHAVIVVVHCK
jgi:hypothetical protein